MKLIVTGGAGFIGSNFIISQINNHGNSVLNYDSLTYAGNINNLATVKDHPSYIFVNEDICNKKILSKTINDYKPDAIVHFAAESHVDRSIDSPNKFINTNVIGTLNLLDCARACYSKNKNFKFLHVSTDEVYGSLGKNGLFTEKTPYAPSSPYSASKASSDHLVRAWWKTYDLPILVTNCSNNYGPFQFPEKLIPLMIANCLDKKPLPIYGSGENIRDWLYVEDHCRAIHCVLKNGQIGDTYNIGGNTEIKNIDIVIKICSILDEIKPIAKNSSYKNLITYVKDRPGHDFRYAIDSTKIQKELKWKPLESFNTGIYKTIKWYLDNESWWRDIQNKNYKQERLGLAKI